RRREDRTGALREERREVAADDLAGGPPEELAGRDGRVSGAAAELGAQERRRLSGEEQAPQHGAERLRLDRRSRRGGDRLCGGVGLLRGDAALLDRERGGVPRGEDVVQPLDAAVRVGRDEPVRVART